jgi:hypothetical protein
MIKFFRRIRYDLIGKNKTGKYLKYAIGEIILVVIGILIALSINNWNEVRVKQLDINYSLVQILNDLSQDNNELEMYNRNETKRISKLTDISKSIINKKELDSLLMSLDMYINISLNNSGYSALKTSGKISNINNSELKYGLTNYYEEINEDLVSASNYSETFTNNHVVPFVINNLRPNIDMTISNDLVLEKLETSNLRYLINYQISVKNYSLSQIKKALISNNTLVKLIEKELDLKK